MKHSNFSFKNRAKSFSYAFNGLIVLIKEEHNSWIHIMAAIFVVAAGFFFKINIYEWLAIIFSIGLVFTLELINSSIENIADFISPGLNPRIKKIKDMSAGAVLIAAITSFTIGIIIFLPKIINLCTV